MQIRTLAIIGCAALVLTGCGRVAESRLNPLRWFGGSNQPATLDPKGGYATQTQDSRPGLAQITGARWEPLYEGRMLVVTAVPATKGWWGAELITEVPMPRGRIRPDDNGVLRLRLVANPPAAGTPLSRTAANPVSDTITVPLTLSNAALSRLREVVITGAGNAVTLRK